MATKLFLLETSDAHTIGGVPFLSGDLRLWDMITVAGAGELQRNTNTAASGTEIQITLTAGGDNQSWISGRVPVGGFTLTSCDFSVWFAESSMSANCGARCRVFRWQPGGILTELGGGPFNDGVEFSVAPTYTEMTWVGNVTDTAFQEDDRIVLRVYLTNVGTMGGGFTCSISYNAADGSQGDSFLNLAETVTFKSETDPPARQRALQTSGRQAVKRASSF